MLRSIGLILLIACVAPAGAHASTTFGPSPDAATIQTVDCTFGGSMTYTAGSPGTPPADSGCVVATDGAGAEARSPVGGVVVGWRAKVGTAASVRLRLLRFTGGGTYTPQSDPLVFAGTSGAASLPAGTAITTPTRLPILAGDVLGLEWVGSTNASFRAPASNTSGRIYMGHADGKEGAQANLTQTQQGYVAAPVQVVIEPDADGDGFGDESQDGCAGTAGAADGCPPGRIVGTVTNGAGATVFVDANSNGVVDNGERSTTAGSDGRYEFAHLSAGNYGVRVVPLSMTTCDPGCRKDVLVSDQTVTVDFTLFFAPAAPGPTPDTTAPVLSPMAITPRTFAVNPKGAVLSRTKRGATLRFTSSEAGTGTFTVSSARPGRKSGKRCVATRKRVPSSRRCTRFTPVAAFTRAVPAGANNAAFSARFKIGTATRSLAVGRYRVALVVADGAGNRSNTVTTTFTITR